MRWRIQRSPPAESAFEEWLKRCRKELVLGAEPTGTQSSCPGDEFLQSLAQKSQAIDLLDPRIDHAASCPACMRRLSALQDKRSRQSAAFHFAIGALVCGALITGAFWLFRTGFFVHSLGDQAAVVAETIDLSAAGTYRGDQPTQLSSAALPHAVVRLTLVLPRFSTPGKYLISVTKDRAGTQAVGAAAATSSGDDRSRTVTVTLDLRSARPGPHFLSTTREQDQASYYYPLEIQ